MLLVILIIVSQKYTCPLALGICWHGSTHTISVALAPAVELMFASLGLIKLRCRVNIVSSKHLQQLIL